MSSRTMFVFPCFGSYVTLSQTMSFPKFGRIAEMRPEKIMLMRVKPRDRGQIIWLELDRGRLTAKSQGPID
jgi:hypothetical protein